MVYFLETDANLHSSLKGLLGKIENKPMKECAVNTARYNQAALKSIK